MITAIKLHIHDQLPTALSELLTMIPVLFQYLYMRYQSKLVCYIGCICAVLAMVSLRKSLILYVRHFNVNR